MRANFRDHRPQILSSLKPGDVLIAFFVLYFLLLLLRFALEVTERHGKKCIITVRLLKFGGKR